MTPAGFPHSDIPGSKPVCGSPRLIAAYYVLPRLPAPRHPPCTLSSLTKLEFLLLGESNRFLPDSVVNEPRQFAAQQTAEVSERPLGRDAHPVDRWDPRFRANPAPPRNRASHRPPVPASGGADGCRTDDLRLARAALSQLSYSPGSRPADQSTRAGGPR